LTKFTVFGASGFIGGYLAAKLADRGHQVSRPQRGELRSLDGCDIGHAFYCLGIDDAHKNPFGAVEAHISHLAEVLRVCSFSSLTYLSSTRVYLGSKSSHEDAQLCIFPNDDNAIYNVTKITGEQICLAAGRPTVRVVRLSNVIGFAPRGISLIPALIKNALGGKQMRLTISRQSSKDYIAIEDVLDLLPRIALEGGQRRYNVASGINVTLGEIVGIIQRQFPSAAEWLSDSPTMAFPPIDIARIRSEFSFAPRSPTEALACACAQFRQRLSAPIGA
jgi:nucleoside-diphosphate-sugar epimerase